MPWCQHGLLIPRLVVHDMLPSYDDVIKGNMFRVTGHLCGEFTGCRGIPAKLPVTRSFDVFFDLQLNRRLGKRSWDWWFETPSRSSWSHCNGLPNVERSFDHYKDNTAEQPSLPNIYRWFQMITAKWSREFVGSLRTCWSISSGERKQIGNWNIQIFEANVTF